MSSKYAANVYRTKDQPKNVRTVYGTTGIHKEVDDTKFSKNDRILKLYSEGNSILDISKKLNLGQGEVSLVINLYKGAVAE